MNRPDRHPPPPLSRLRCSAVSAALAGLGLACSADASDLVQNYHEALVNDAIYSSARANLEANREKEPQGLSLLLPQLSATASDTYNTTDIVEPPQPTLAITYPSRAFAIQLTQPLFRWGNWQQYQQSKLMVMQAESQFVQVQQDLILRVAQAYFDVLEAEDNINFLNAQKAAISEQLASAQRNFEVGTATITDTKEAQSRYDLAVAQEIAASSDLEVKQSALEQIIGKQPSALAPLRTGVTLAGPEPAQLEPWVASAVSQNPQVAQSAASLEIAHRQIEVNRSNHYPTVDLIASRQYSRSPTSILPPALGATTTNSVGVQISIPLYSGGYASSKVREALALEDKAGSDLESARRNATQSTRQAYTGVVSGLAQVKALEAAERSSQSALDYNKLGYQVGVRINIDVLNAQQQLYSTERDLAKARYDTLLNGLRLKGAAGTLKEDDLQQINGLLTH
jgi:outer membrane protein